jgi:hypothetical protein
MAPNAGKTGGIHIGVNPAVEVGLEFNPSLGLNVASNFINMAPFILRDSGDDSSAGQHAHYPNK